MSNKVCKEPAKKTTPSSCAGFKNISGCHEQRGSTLNMTTIQGGSLLNVREVFNRGGTRAEKRTQIIKKKKPQDTHIYKTCGI